MFIKIPEIIASRLRTLDSQRQLSTGVRTLSISTTIPIISQYVARQEVSLQHSAECLKTNHIRHPATKSSISLPMPINESKIASENDSQPHLSPLMRSSSLSSVESAGRLEKSNRPLEKVFCTTKKIFMCSTLTIDDLQLSFSELNLLVEVFNKKFTIRKLTKITDENIDKSRILDDLNACIQSHSSTKRIEENNKFVYKYTFKYLRQQFYVKEGLEKSVENEVLFYRYYFQESATRLNIPLENFFDPLYKVCNKNPHFKSINNKYLSLIFSSPIFKTDFFEFLNKEFRNTYYSIIHLKLRKFYKRLRTDIISDRSMAYVDTLTNRFVERLKKNKKCKLPWTIKEVNSALSHFQSLIYYY